MHNGTSPSTRVVANAIDTTTMHNPPYFQPPSIVATPSMAKLPPSLLLALCQPSKPRSYVHCITSRASSMSSLAATTLLPSFLLAMKPL